MTTKNCLQPTNKEYIKLDSIRSYGVEIECIADRQGKRDISTPFFDTKEDGSLPRYTGEEKVSHILTGQHGMKAILELSELLRKEKYKVNKDCGLHCHVNARDLLGSHITNITSWIYRYEKPLFGCFPENRRLNHFCRKTWISRDEINLIHIEGWNKGQITVLVPSRYYGYNLQALSKHSTIEFRYHQGTLDANKILNYVQLCLAIVEKGKNQYIEPNIALDNNKENLEELLSSLGMPETSNHYWRSRWTKNNVSKTRWTK